MNGENRVLLFRGRGLISALIRWQTRSEWSHAALQFGNCVIESWQGAGVRARHLAEIGFEGVDSFSVPTMNLAQWSAAKNYATRQIGKRYDYRGVARFVTRRHSSPDDRWFCSELVFDALASAGVNLLARVEGCAVSPAMLALSPLLKREVTRRTGGGLFTRMEDG